MEQIGSKEVAAAAVKIAMSEDRQEERRLRGQFQEADIQTVAIDYGGEFSNAVPKILERAVVAAKREGVIGESHAEEGAVAGAAHEAIIQIMNKAMGLNLGGKIGIARHGAHISVCVFFAVGLLNLNDVVIGLGHRAV
ncbi:MAG TPA: HutP family protein [Candidatus Avimonoglobus intestinipullorum]|uniref:Hut operon positive regulatory protein n=1 Tax=Candidatus Avimonoglobus intestinipullorum TaxID=2840699 RepID=A0A9D1S6L5_9FIRM|nr:HutP family protein [Candidatus Avimonoglobus intestinipullorum]